MLDGLMPFGLLSLALSPLAAAQESRAVALDDLDGYWTHVGPAQNDEGRIELLQSFEAGFIVLAVALSILGAACSLELLLRRTSNRGAWNISLLVGAGTSFGAISCFALHFIGNNSLTLLRPATASEPAQALTLAYDPGYTILSLIVSVLSMIVAFTVMGLDLDSLKRKKKPSAPGDGHGSESSYGSRDDAEKDKPTPSSAADEALKPGARGGGSHWWSAVARHGRRARKHEEEMDPGVELRAKLKAIEREDAVRNGLTMASLAQHERETAAQEAAEKQQQQVEGGHTPEAVALGLETFRFGSGPPEGAMPPSSFGPPDGDESSQEGDDEMERFNNLTSLRRNLAGPAHLAENAVAGPSKPSYRLPSILPPAAGPGVDLSSRAGPSADSYSSDRSEFASDASVSGKAAALSPSAPIFTAVDFAASARKSSQSSTVSPLHRTRPNMAERTASYPAPPDQAATTLSPFRKPARAAPLTPSSINSAHRRASLPAVSPPYRRPQQTIVIQDQMTFEEFEHSEFGGGRLALICGSQSSEGTNASSGRKDSATTSSERRASGGPRRPSALTNASFVGPLGDGWGTDSASGVDPFTPGTPVRPGETESQSQTLRSSWLAKRPSMRKPYSPDKPTVYRDEEEALAHLSSLRQSRAGSLGVVDPAGSDGLGNPKQAKNLSWAARHLGVGQSTKVEMVKVVVAGTLCGFGVVGMHYIGQRSITSIHVGLWSMFIVLRPKLSHSYIKRGLVATILGSATAAMHFVAMMGSSYAVSLNATLPTSATQIRAKNAITALVASLAAVAGLVTVASAIFAQKKLRINRAKRRGLVMATAIFDDEGNILASPEGLLPMQNIALESIHITRPIFLRSLTGRHGSISTDSVNSSVLTSEFDITPQHQAFIAALRQTWAWRKGTSDDAPQPEVPLVIHSAPSERYSSGLEAPLPQRVQHFLDRFSDSTGRLADEVLGSSEQPQLARLGVLFDRILTTGFITFGTDGKEPGPSDSASSGQMLFLVNRCSPEQKSQLSRRGFMFHSPRAVSRIMSGALAVPPNDMFDFLQSVQSFSDVLLKPQLQRGKVYVSALIAQALPRGLQVAIDKADRNILPSRELGSFTSTSEPILSLHDANPTFIAPDIAQLGELVASISGTSLLSFAYHETSDAATATGEAKPSATAVHLKRLLATTLLPLFDRTPPEVAHRILSRLVLSPSLIPLFPPSSSPHRSSRLPSYAIVFRAVLMPNEDVTDLGPALYFESFKLFRAFNECFMSDLFKREGVKFDRRASVDHPPSAADSKIYARRPSKVQFIDNGPNGSGGGFLAPVTGQSTLGSTPGGFLLNPDYFSGTGAPPSDGAHSRTPSQVSLSGADEPPSPGASTATRGLLPRPSLSRVRSSGKLAQDQRAFPPPAASASANAMSRPSMVRQRSADGYSLRPTVAAFDPRWMLTALRDDPAY